MPLVHVGFAGSEPLGAETWVKSAERSLRLRPVTRQLATLAAVCWPLPSRPSCARSGEGRERDPNDVRTEPVGRSEPGERYVYTDRTVQEPHQRRRDHSPDRLNT
jgi:hypothetical protein